MSTGIYVLECGPGEIPLRDLGKSISEKFEERWFSFGGRRSEQLAQWRSGNSGPPYRFKRKRAPVK